MSDNTEQPAFLNRPALLCAIGYTLFVLYASLVPLHFQPLAWREAVAQFRNLFSRPISFEDWPDVATNVLLFIPLAFLWLGCIKRPGSRRRTLWLVIIATVGCAILSTAIEFVQLWFPPRDTTLNDIVAESIGAAIGGGLWLWNGGVIAAMVAASITAAKPRNNVQWLLFAYCVSLACLAIMPLERTFSGSDLFQNFHEGKIAEVPFGYNYASAVGLACSVLRDVICFAPVGAYLAGCLVYPAKTTQVVWWAVLPGVAFVTVLALMQVIVYGRVFSAVGLMSGCGGVALGYLAMRRQMSRPRESPATQPTISLLQMWIFLASVVAICVMLELWASR